jgi:hydroxyacyl-ACP dehydratase HTD2-like protein with hotdog domain
MTGRTVMNYVVVNNRLTIDVSELSDGIYIIQATDETEVLGRGRILKE